MGIDIFDRIVHILNTANFEKERSSGSRRKVTRELSQYKHWRKQTAV